MPLQVLLRTHPDWLHLPAAVVDRDKPSGTLLWVNERARAHRILTGMRYAAGLGLSHELRAGVVTDGEIALQVARLTRRLARFSPDVEPADQEPGVFWIDVSALRHLYPSLQEWARLVRTDLQAAGFHSVVSVGFTRYGTYAASMSGARELVFRNVKEEEARVKTVTLDRLGLEQKLRDKLLKLGIRTSGDFMKLPADGIRKRFGIAAQELHRQANGEGWQPIKPAALSEPVIRKTILDYTETNAERLGTLIAPLLQSMLGDLSERHEALRQFRFKLTLDDKTHLDETLLPAAPTLDARQILNLIQLRLNSLVLTAGVIELRMHATGVPATERQLTLFRETPRRDLQAAERAFARIRAELGNDAVMHARLHEGHMPEAQYLWEPMKEFLPAQPDETKPRQLIRRLYKKRIPLPPRSRHEPDGWLIADLADGPAEETLGPYVISGGWWTREVTRSYYYVRVKSGRWLWVYNDHKRQRWFLQGELE
ncbi:MAG: Y-family DNA polymerase [Limisphaerales bacterium]